MEEKRKTLCMRRDIILVAEFLHRMRGVGKSCAIRRLPSFSSLRFSRNQRRVSVPTRAPINSLPLCRLSANRDIRGAFSARADEDEEEHAENEVADELIAQEHP